MFSALRNTALTAAVVGLALTGPARATVLVDYNNPIQSVLMRCASFISTPYPPRSG